MLMMTVCIEPLGATTYREIYDATQRFSRIAVPPMIFCKNVSCRSNKRSNEVKPGATKNLISRRVSYQVSTTRIPSLLFLPKVYYAFGYFKR